MTVKELREFLSNYDDDIEVGVSHDAGFCTAPLDAKDAILEKRRTGRKKNGQNIGGG